jgi:prepilin-type processing-associated H-X9-DG protein
VILGVRERKIPGNPYAKECPDGPYPFHDGSLTNQCDKFHFWSLHSGGANFVFGDGSVRFLPYSADAMLPALATRAGARWSY